MSNKGFYQHLLTNHAYYCEEPTIAIDLEERHEWLHRGNDHNWQERLKKGFGYQTVEGRARIIHSHPWSNLKETK